MLTKRHRISQSSTTDAAWRQLLSLCLTLAAGLFVLACQPKLGAKEEVYLVAVKQQDLRFAIDSTESAAAWERARRFFVQHSLGTLQRDSPMALETVPTAIGDAQGFGYRILREVGGAQHQYSVDCYTLDVMLERDAQLNAHILAYYIRTGEIKPEFLRGRRQ